MSEDYQGNYDELVDRTKRTTETAAGGLFVASECISTQSRQSIPVNQRSLDIAQKLGDVSFALSFAAVSIVIAEKIRKKVVRWEYRRLQALKSKNQLDS